MRLGFYHIWTRKIPDRPLYYFQDIFFPLLILSLYICKNSLVSGLNYGFMTIPLVAQPQFRSDTASKRSASLTPDLNLRTLTNACKVDDPRVDVTGYPKQGYQWPLKKLVFY